MWENHVAATNKSVLSSQIQILHLCLLSTTVRVTPVTSTDSRKIRPTYEMEHRTPDCSSLRSRPADRITTQRPSLDNSAKMVCWGSQQQSGYENLSQIEIISKRSWMFIVFQHSAYKINHDRSLTLGICTRSIFRRRQKVSSHSTTLNFSSDTFIWASFVSKAQHVFLLMTINYMKQKSLVYHASQEDFESNPVDPRDIGNLRKEAKFR